MKFLVMDEADRLLDASFESDLRSLLAVLPTDNRQTLLFSATLTASLVKLQQASLEDAYVFQVCWQLLPQPLRQQVGRRHAADVAGLGISNAWRCMLGGFVQAGGMEVEGVLQVGAG